MSVKRQKTSPSNPPFEEAVISSTYSNKHGSQHIKVSKGRTSLHAQPSLTAKDFLSVDAMNSSAMSPPATGQKARQATDRGSTSTQSNGHSTPPTATVNRKKQKRREKEAAKKAALAMEQMKVGSNARSEYQTAAQPYMNYGPSEPEQLVNGKRSALNPLSHAPQYWQDPMNPNAYGEYGDQDQGLTMSEAEEEEFQRLYPGSYPVPPRGRTDFDPTSTGMGFRDNQRPANHTSASMSHPGSRYAPGMPYMHGVPPPPPPPLQMGYRQQHTRSRDLWNTSTQEERERIKEFWLSLGEGERRSLVKVEKEAVLRKMKEQQKHSCTCTVCGRKRTAIEEELEVLYDAYYEELESYAHHQHPKPNGKHVATKHVTTMQDRFGNQPLPYRSRPSQRALQQGSTSADSMQHMGPDEDSDDGEYSEEGDEEDEEDDEEDDEYDESEEGGIMSRMPSAADDFFTFGNALTVQDGILTVADDLLKNDGKKFIEMMEQLAERRMQREEEAQYSAATMVHPSMGMSGHHPPHSHPQDTQPPLEDEIYDDPEDDDYESGEEDDYDDDEVHAMTEGQRMEEGRRMFQIFAARMFEQRVLTAYREKVARERQQKLLEELEEEDKQDEQREKKKAKEAQKRKDKKARQKALKDEEKSRKDEEKAAEEAAVKASEDKRLEEQRIRKEGERKKREAERKAREEERLKKEADRLKRQQEDREKQAEVERKARELKENEKKKRQEQLRKGKEEREARDKAEKNAKAEKAKAELSERQKVESERVQREAQVKADQKARDREKKEQQEHARAQAQLAKQATKRTSAAHSLPVPKVAGVHTIANSYVSPLLPVAAPALPKAPSPSTQPNSSSQTSSLSSPRTGAVETHPQLPVSIGLQPGSHTMGGVGFLNPMMRPPDPHMYGHVQREPSASVHHPVSRPPGMPNGFYRPQEARPYPAHLGHQNIFQASYPFSASSPQPQSQQPMNPPFVGAPLSHGAQPHFITSLHASGSASSIINEKAGLSSLPINTVHEDTSHMIRSPAASHAILSHHGDRPSSQRPSPELNTSGPKGAIAPPKPITRPSIGFSQSRESRKDRNGEDTEPLGSSALLADDEPDFEPQGPSQRQKMMPPSFPSAKDVSSMSAFSSKPTSNVSKSWSIVPTPQTSTFSRSPWTPQTSNSLSGWGSTNANSSSTFQGSSTTKGSAISSIDKRKLMVEICSDQTTALLDGYHEIGMVTEKMNQRLPAGQPPIELQEVNILCDTFGDDKNGGGSFDIREDSKFGRLIKCEANESSRRQQQKRMGSGGGMGNVGQIGSASSSTTAVPGSVTKGHGFGNLMSPISGFASLNGGL